MNWNEANEKAEKVIPRVTLKERPHYLTGERYASFKFYDVLLDGKVIGSVENVTETTHRKAGRLIARTWRKKSWAYRSAELRGVPIPRSTRKSAIEDLIIHLIRDEKLKA